MIVINCPQLLAVKKVRGCQGFPFLLQIDSLTGTALQKSVVRYVASLMMLPSCPHVPRPSENMWGLKCPEQQKETWDWRPLLWALSINLIIKAVFRGKLTFEGLDASLLLFMGERCNLLHCRPSDRKHKSTGIEKNWNHALTLNMCSFKRPRGLLFNCSRMTVKATLLFEGINKRLFNLKGITEAE